MQKTKKLHNDIFWDYKKYSENKKLERIALLFPQIGRDKKTVEKLYKNIDKLKIPENNKKLIKLYYKLIQGGELS